VAELGTDGPARRSSLLSPAWWTGPPPIPRRGPPRATNRVTRPPRRSPPQEAARGFWIRAWGQREPALQGTGRSNDPARWPGRSRVGWTFPATHAKCNSLRIEHPIRTLTHRAWSRAEPAGIAVSAHMALSQLKRRRPWFISRSNKALATLPFLSKVVCRRPKPEFHAEHERPGFLTACDHLEQPQGLPC
jgi:hypothetical protein